jgi:hypothetical protein
MGFKISYPQGRWIDVTTDIGMAIGYFMDFDRMTHALTGVSQMISNDKSERQRRMWSIEHTIPSID